MVNSILGALLIFGSDGIGTIATLEKTFTATNLCKISTINMAKIVLFLK